MIDEPAPQRGMIQINDAQPTAKGALGLEDFDLVEKLGKGSFGSVFLVK